MRLRRLVLFGGVLTLAAMSARRAHANRDPSELSVGGGSGAHDAHLSCGPDVRVQHASGGFAYQRVFQAEGRDPGEGTLVDFRGGVGTTKITDVSDAKCGATDATCKDNVIELRKDIGNTHVLMSGQILAGFDWGGFALAGGLGYFGLATTQNSNREFDSKFVPLPAIDIRVGRRRGGFSADFGLGSTPVAGFTRWYALYAIGQFRFKEGGEVGAGLIAIPAGEVDARSGILFKGGVPITDWMTIGGFGVLNANDQSTLTGFNWTAGGQVTFLLEEME
jgi:hypothetical protein